MIPAESLRHFLSACLWGLGLGVWYDFFAPPRRRHPHLTDLVFLAGLFWAWLEVAFGICGGDIRLGCCAGLAWGFFLWRLTLGRVFRVPVARFWGFWDKLLGLLLKKIGVLKKFFLASGKKWLQ